MSSIFIMVEPPVWVRLGKGVNVFFSRMAVSWNPLYWSLELGGAAADDPPSVCCQSNAEMLRCNVHVYSIAFTINSKRMYRKPSQLYSKNFMRLHKGMMNLYCILSFILLYM